MHFLKSILYFQIFKILDWVVKFLVSAIYIDSETMHSITLLIEVDCYASIFFVCIVLGFILICYKALQIILSLIQIIEHHGTANMSTFAATIILSTNVLLVRYALLYLEDLLKMILQPFELWDCMITILHHGVPESIHTHPEEGQWKFQGGRGHESLNEGLKVYCNFGKGDAEVILKTFHGRVWVFSETKQCHKQGNGPTFCTFFMSKNY